MTRETNEHGSSPFIFRTGHFLSSRFLRRWFYVMNLGWFKAEGRTCRSIPGIILYIRISQSSVRACKIVRELRYLKHVVGGLNLWNFRRTEFVRIHETFNYIYLRPYFYHYLHRRVFDVCTLICFTLSTEIASLIFANDINNGLALWRTCNG